MAAKETDKDLDVEELAASSGLSVTTIWRMKRAGEIPYYQRGKNTRVTFPPDAIKATLSTRRDQEEPKRHPSEQENKIERPPGPRPDWMKKKHNREDDNNA